MGTRGLTAVIQDGTHKIAQYGQWDHYPSGQGITALRFVQFPENIQNLKNVLPRVEFLSDAKYAELTDPVTGGADFITMEQSKQIDELLPAISRNHGAEILEMIANSASTSPIFIRDAISFANDSLFCEWAYVIDLDNEVFEVYEGFQTSPHSEGRFASDSANEEGYYPVKLVATFSFDDLPSEEEFTQRLEGDEN